MSGGAPSKEDVRELERIYDIYDPFIAESTEREPFIVTLRSGVRVQLAIPLKAAVKIEEAGHDIVAGTLAPGERGYGHGAWYK